MTLSLTMSLTMSLSMILNMTLGTISSMHTIRSSPAHHAATVVVIIAHTIVG